MSIDDLNALVAMLLAISLAAERLVTFAKNAWPEFLAFEKKNKAREIDLPSDRWRRITVQLIGFAAAWTCAAFLTTDAQWDPFGSMSFGIDETKNLPVWIIGALASSGSALWSNVLAFTSATKDLRKQMVADQGLDFEAKAKRMRKGSPVDSGEAGREQGGDEGGGN